MITADPDVNDVTVTLCTPSYTEMETAALPGVVAPLTVIAAVKLTLLLTTVTLADSDAMVTTGRYSSGSDEVKETVTVSPLLAYAVLLLLEDIVTVGNVGVLSVTIMST